MGMSKEENDLVIESERELRREILRLQMKIDALQDQVTDLTEEKLIEAHVVKEPNLMGGVCECGTTILYGRCNRCGGPKI